MLCISKKTIEAIVDSGNNYVIQVKRNAKKLFVEIESQILHQKPLSCFVETEKNHGRHSTWTVRTFNALHIEMQSEWKNVCRIIHVHKQTIKGEKYSDNNRFYITNLSDTDAQFFHTSIRAHWKIENSLHWVKDVVHKEDKNRMRTANGPINTAVFGSIAINLHRKHGDYSITLSQIKFGANVKELFKLIRT